MTALRDLACFASTVATAMLPIAVLAQPDGKPSSAWQAGWQPTSRSSLGLQLDASHGGLPCAAAALVCDAGDRTAHLRASAMVGKFWGLELGYAEAGRMAVGENRTQGVNLSLIGRAPLGSAFNIYGKLGTTYARPDRAVLGAAAGPGFGLSYGAGVSFALTPRLSATLEWDNNDLRFPSTTQEPVRSTSLGLRYRY